MEVAGHSVCIHDDRCLRFGVRGLQHRRALHPLTRFWTSLGEYNRPSWELSMATLQTSLADYLRTSYRPDCDYVDGEVQERNFGEFDHAATQGFLILWFGQHRQEWGLRVLPEIRIR